MKANIHHTHTKQRISQSKYDVPSLINHINQQIKTLRTQYARLDEHMLKSFTWTEKSFIKSMPIMGEPDKISSSSLQTSPPLFFIRFVPLKEHLHD